MVDIPNRNGEYLMTLPTLNKKHVQDFMKRLRGKLSEKLKYYAVGEYGEKTQRPHYHMLIFGLNKSGRRLEKYLYDKWTYGQIDIGSVNAASIRYITNYMVQKAQYKNPFIQNPFSLMSKGIGKQYLEKQVHIDKHHNDLERNYMMFEDGQKSRLPRYYREKIYCENTRIKQNEKAIIDGDKRELTNIEKWYQKNKNGNHFQNEYEQYAHYTKQVEKKLKNNAKI
jgi:hypothetical protein